MKIGIDFSIKTPFSSLNPCIYYMIKRNYLFRYCFLVVILLTTAIACKKDKTIPTQTTPVQTIPTQLPSSFLAEVEKLSIPNSVKLPTGKNYTKLAAFFTNELVTYKAFFNGEGSYWQLQPNTLSLKLYDDNNENIGIYSHDNDKDFWTIANSKGSLIAGEYESQVRTASGNGESWVFGLNKLKNPPQVTGIFQNVKYIQYIIDANSFPKSKPTQQQVDDGTEIKLLYKQAFFFYKENP